MRNDINFLKQLSNKDGIISALALDQRGSLKKMLTKESGKQADNHDMSRFKKVVASRLSNYASAILLDPQVGLPAARARDKHCGLLLSYEVSGFDTSRPGHMPRLLEDWSVKRLKEVGAQAIKVMLYYDANEGNIVNRKKHAFIERIGDETKEEGLPFFLELMTYDVNISGTKNPDYAKVRPYKVNAAIREFSKPRYNVSVLKVEVPVDMHYVDGYSQGNPSVYSKAKARQFFKDQNEATHNVPFIFLSGGVSAKMFQESLKLAHSAGSSFDGVLCGRATWAPSVQFFAKEGEKITQKWLNTTGRQNIEKLNNILSRTAVPWEKKMKLTQPV